MRIKYATMGILTGIFIIAFLRWIGVPISAFNVFSLLGDPSPLKSILVVIFLLALIYFLFKKPTTNRGGNYEEN
ncbi:hypothetical protein ACFQ4N_16215 [Oceanobacillus iheyensis]|uniref:Uncharacterized protein n=1 Tax=Oceanobacillus iheyensis (strain DSM 14371 / CIP 107618 / JCM 11309 / KCTC 3954 / HTE831) TaxID=221109 RepID=Q8EL48_OCEIH|nr:hypothetical protein [Oceanobacillus iheyensis]BAC15339.1 hypothetical protein [Oceanobacillus iheyensis HTE831]